MGRKKKPQLIGQHGPELGQLDARRVEWLVKGMFPLGTVSAITGPKDSGKSFLCCALAADAAGGPRLGAGKPRREGAALWYTAEEDPASMTAPRLFAAGCPSDGVLFPMHDRAGMLVSPLHLPCQMQRLDTAMRDTSAALVILDPPTGFMDEGKSPNATQDVEAVMQCLNLLAQRHGAAVVLILQMNKRQYGGTSDKVSGNARWLSATRVAVRLGFHPSRRDARLLTFARFALGRRPSAREYAIEDYQGEGRFVLLDEAEYTDEDAGTADLDSCQWAEQIDGTDWLRAVLADGRQEAKGVWKRWQEAGYGRNQYWRARKELCIVVDREGQGFGHAVYLSLPTHSRPLHPDLLCKAGGSERNGVQSKGGADAAP